LDRAKASPFAKHIPDWSGQPVQPKHPIVHRIGLTQPLTPTTVPDKTLAAVCGRTRIALLRFVWRIWQSCELQRLRL
jgi:hypothetical protein